MLHIVCFAHLRPELEESSTFFKIHFNVILPSTVRCHKLSLPFRCSDWNIWNFLHSPSHARWIFQPFYHPNHIWWKVKLRSFSLRSFLQPQLTSCFRIKYFPHRPVLKQITVYACTRSHKNRISSRCCFTLDVGCMSMIRRVSFWIRSVCCLFVAWLAYSSNFKMNAARSSGISVNFYHNTRGHIAEDIAFHSLLRSQETSYSDTYSRHFIKFNI
jgi:hypothetical protein